jgi:glycosyltransferase involved in cell wall biosynthesis
VRILQLAPLWETVPPSAYGGTEAVVSVLCEELVRQGHEVTLCASGDSVTSAELFSVYHRSLRTADDLQDRQPYDWMHVARSLKEAADSFDIAHNHAGELAMAMSHLADVPMLSTMHCLITPDTQFVWDRYRGWYNTISYAQRYTMPPIREGIYCGVVHNGIDVESFPYEERKEDYLLFLGRIAPEKGTHLAIEVARRLGKCLVIAAKVDRVDRQYFHDSVEPLIDGELIQFVGEADAALKRKLYAGAYCLLVPICWEEPFGLVMAEAMACGTPVIAFARGAAPEVVVDGETGFLVHNVDDMAQAVHRVDRIDPWRCRRHVEENFSAQRMTEAYVALYERILEDTAIGERLAVAAHGPSGEENSFLTEASQLAEAAASRQDEGSTDEELAVA